MVLGQNLKFNITHIEVDLTLCPSTKFFFGGKVEIKFIEEKEPRGTCIKEGGEMISGPQELQKAQPRL